MRAIGILVILTIIISANGLRSACIEMNVTLAAASPNRAQQGELAIIINKSNPNDNISLAELREYFLAERSHWSGGGGKVRVVMREPGRPERDAVLNVIYHMDEKRFTSYCLGKKFTGEVMDFPWQKNSTAEVIKFTSYVPGAIGYVRADEVDASVKVLRVGGLAPGEPGYMIRF